MARRKKTGKIFVSTLDARRNFASDPFVTDLTPKSKIGISHTASSHIASKMSKNQGPEEEASAEEAKITEELAKDRPTIDGAVKSFVSLFTARSMSESASDKVHPTTVLGLVPEHSGTITVPTTAIATAPSTATTTTTHSASADHNSSDDAKSTLQDSLAVARAIVKAVNAHKFPLQHVHANTYTSKPNLSEEKRLQYVQLSVVARLWNGLIDSEQKPSRFLGRKALRYAWKDMDISLPQENDDSSKERQQSMLQQFETLLFHHHDEASGLDDDSALIWASDGGQHELAKRQQRRKQGATDRTKEVIEEIARY
jgi:hypothetical protein